MVFISLDQARINLLTTLNAIKVKKERPKKQYLTPEQEAVKLVELNYGKVNYVSPMNGESLGGIFATRNAVLSVINSAKRYDRFNRPLLDSEPRIIVLGNSKAISRQEMFKRRRFFIESSQVAGPKITDYSGILGEWGANPKSEPTTKQIRKIFEICKGSDIPIWICDTLEPVLDWKAKPNSVSSWLEQNYSQYLGFPLYKIPPIDYALVDVEQLPELERRIILSGKLDSCQTLAEQNMVLLSEACKFLGLDPVILNQERLRDVGAFKSGIDKILSNKELLEESFGKFFRVECPSCGKYVFNVELKNNKVYGVCDGKKKAKFNEEETVQYEGCGKELERGLDYLYEKSYPGKILTSLYMSEGDCGILFPDREFVSARIYSGPFVDQVRTTGELLDSGIPEVIKTGSLTLEGRVMNIFELLDLIPAEQLVETLNAIPSQRNAKLNRKELEITLRREINKLNPPTCPNLVADVLNSLGATSINFSKLCWNLNGESLYVLNLLTILGKLRNNSLLESKPSEFWPEKYCDFIDSTFIPEEKVDKLRKYLIDKDAPIKTILETVYLATLMD
jgi:hypothetical protein